MKLFLNQPSSFQILVEIKIENQIRICIINLLNKMIPLLHNKNQIKTQNC